MGLVIGFYSPEISLNISVMIYIRVGKTPNTQAIIAIPLIFNSSLSQSQFMLSHRRCTIHRCSSKRKETRRGVVR